MLVDAHDVVHFHVLGKDNIFRLFDDALDASEVGCRVLLLRVEVVDCAQVEEGGFRVGAAAGADGDDELVAFVPVEAAERVFEGAVLEALVFVPVAAAGDELSVLVAEHPVEVAFADDEPAEVDAFRARVGEGENNLVAAVRDARVSTPVSD